MNHQDIEQLFSRARNVRLSEEARTAGRAALLARMSSGTAAPYPAHRFNWLGSAWLRAGSFASFLFLVGGTAWAAEGALPGDALYVWKTKVNEPARLAVLPTPVARAEWSVELISRRLGEAEALASNGKLDENTQALLEEKLNQERDRADAFSQSSGDENCEEIEAEIKARIESVRHVEVREDAGRLRIRVREEHEEEETEEEKRRENEVRYDDGWIEENELHEDQHESDDDDTDVQASRQSNSVIEKKSSAEKISESKKESSVSAKSSTPTSEQPKSESSGKDGEDDEDSDGSDTAEDDQEELISESAARSKALAAVPGTVKESELKDEDDDPVWEVKIRRSSDSEEVKVIVDARSGSIKKIED